MRIRAATAARATAVGIAVAFGAFAVAAAMDAPRSSASGDPSPALRVLTFNVRYDEPADGDNAWSRRRDLVASMIRFHAADLAGLQEPLAEQVVELQAALPEYGWIGVGRGDGESRGEFSPIFYRKERLDLLDHGTFWLSETPDEAGSRGWDAALPRIATWARVRDRAAGREFLAVNTHFDHMGKEARAHSARLLVSRTQSLAKGAPIVLTGDFNCNETSEPYRILAGSDGRASGGGFADARRLSTSPHHGPTATYHRFGRGLDRTLGKIDHIFVRGPIDVVRHGVLSDTFDGRYPSDHFAVLAEIVFR